LASTQNKTLLRVQLEGSIGAETALGFFDRSARKGPGEVLERDVSQASSALKLITDYDIRVVEELKGVDDSLVAKPGAAMYPAVAASLGFHYRTYFRFAPGYTLAK
jgi:hypothetical protein